MKKGENLIFFPHPNRHLFWGKAQKLQSHHRFDKYSDNQQKQHRNLRKKLRGRILKGVFISIRADMFTPPTPRKTFGQFLKTIWVDSNFCWARGWNPLVVLFYSSQTCPCLAVFVAFTELRQQIETSLNFSFECSLTLRSIDLKIEDWNTKYHILWPNISGSRFTIILSHVDVVALPSSRYCWKSDFFELGFQVQ